MDLVFLQSKKKDLLPNFFGTKKILPMCQFAGLSICLYECLSFCLSVHQSAIPSISLYDCQSVCMNVHHSVCLSISLLFYPSLCLIVSLSEWMLVFLYVCPSVYHSIHPSVWLSVCLYKCSSFCSCVHQSVILSISLSVCPFELFYMWLYAFSAVYSSNYLYFWLSVRPSMFAHLTVCLSICHDTWSFHATLSACRYIHQNICLPVRPTVYMFVLTSVLLSVCSCECLSVYTDCPSESLYLRYVSLR